MAEEKAREIYHATCAIALGTERHCVVSWFGFAHLCAFASLREITFYDNSSFTQSRKDAKKIRKAGNHRYCCNFSGAEVV
jgi:hypothetical protein